MFFFFLQEKLEKELSALKLDMGNFHKHKTSY